MRRKPDRPALLAQLAREREKVGKLSEELAAKDIYIAQLERNRDELLVDIGGGDAKKGT